MGARMGVLALVVSALSLSAGPAPASTLLHTWAGDGNANDSTWTNNGAWVGTEAYTPGAVNNAFSFDGTKYVSVPDDSSHYPHGSFTVDLYAKTEVTSGLQMFMSIYECAITCLSDVSNSDIDVELSDGVFAAFVRDSDAGGPDPSHGQGISGGPS